ncbi:MAG TPA: hypothetical protein VF290_08845 [Pyrinomonadaceae bacterium]
MKQLLFSVVLIILTSGSGQAQGWRGIVPLRSNCESVKGLLKVDRCTAGTYLIGEDNVSISFSDGSCETGWKVSPGTVLSFYVHTRKKAKFTSQYPDSSNFVRSRDSLSQDVVYYENQGDGVTVAVLKDGTIAHTFYGPSSKDLALKCDNEISQEPPLPKGAMKFDQFGFLEKSEEERRLSNFATLMSGWSEATGYIIGYTGKGGGEDGLSRAYRVKDFVIKSGVSQYRLIVLIGAPREESTVELWWINFPRPPR